MTIMCTLEIPRLMYIEHYSKVYFSRDSSPHNEPHTFEYNLQSIVILMGGNINIIKMNLTYQYPDGMRV